MEDVMRELERAMQVIPKDFILNVDLKKGKVETGYVCSSVVFDLKGCFIESKTLFMRTHIYQFKPN